MNQGFSLVELSIVLVILGLVTEGILTGQNLIRAAELRSVGTQIDVYRTATYTFREKYRAIPGDMANATRFWGETASCPDTAGTGTETCDGNGDGILDYRPVSDEYQEWFTYWQHLANAGLIEGTYTGISGPNTGADIVYGENVPNAKLGSNSVLLVKHFTDQPTTGTYFYAGNYGNTIMLGTDGNTNYDGDNATLTPEEMWNLDTKMDDGHPAYGNIFSYVSTRRVGCASTDDPATTEYELTITDIRCTFLFKLGI